MLERLGLVSLACLVCLVLLVDEAKADYDDISEGQADGLFSRCDEQIGKGSLDRAIGRLLSFEHDHDRKSDPECTRIARRCWDDEYPLGSNFHRLCLRFGKGAPLQGLQAAAHLNVRRASDRGPTAIAAAGNVRWVGSKSLAAVLGAEVGSGTDGGMSWDIRFGMGWGRPLRPSSAVAVTLVVGGSSWTDERLPGAFLAGVEAFATTGLGSWGHGVVWARNDFVFGSDSRQNGASLALFGDEFLAGLGLGLGCHRARGGEHQGRGVFVGFTYREQLGEKIPGVMLGYGLAAHNGIRE